MDGYKEAQEKFVSNLNGTSLPVLLSLLLQIPFYILFTKLSHVVFAVNKSHKSSKGWIQLHLLRFLREMAIFVVPMLLVMTVLSEYNHIIVTVQTLFVAGL
jgi:hypothetical protein